MRIHPVDPNVRSFWKIYPVRIPGGTQCPQCDQETVLVQSMGGGFVTRNCPRCNNFTTLPEDIFRQLAIWVACPECKSRMTPDILPDNNYGYTCRQCDIGIPLFALLPRWEDL